MPIAVEIEFDKKSETMVKQIWKHMSQNNISDFLHQSKSIPHITLGVFDDGIDKEKFVMDVKEFCNKIRKTKITLSNVGVFNDEKSVIFLGATVTKELLKIHEVFFKHMKEYKASAWEHYLPKTWVPHVTVAINVDHENILKGVEVAMNNFKKIEIKITTVGIINVKPLKHIDHIELN